MPPEQRKYSRRGVQIGGYRQLPPNKSAIYLQLDRGFPPHGRDIAFDAGRNSVFLGFSRRLIDALCRSRSVRYLKYTPQLRIRLRVAASLQHWQSDAI